MLTATFRRTGYRKIPPSDLIFFIASHIVIYLAMKVHKVQKSRLFKSPGQSNHNFPHIFLVPSQPFLPFISIATNLRSFVHKATEP